MGFPESLHFCTKLVLHTKPNRKANNQFFQTKRGFFRCSVFFDLKENADIGSFSCLCRQEQDECKWILDLPRERILTRTYD